MTKTIGIFADEPYLGTGFSIVSGYLANYLCKKLKIIYFGRFGQERYFRKTPLRIKLSYDYVPCQGGTWNKNLVNKIIKHYKIDILLTIDDWWSIDGLLYATKMQKVPFHFMTPLDSLPISSAAYEKFSQVDALYIPNRSWKIIEEHNKFWKEKKINVKYFPYGCDTNIFRPVPELKKDKFTFVWIGRDEERKALNSAILAFEKIQKKYDVNLLIRTNWRGPNTIRKMIYLNKMGPSIIREQSMKCGHDVLVQTYNRGHVLLCTSKAGGFELQIIEAMACEVPALVTDWNFMNEHIVDGKNGFRIPYNSLETVSHNRTWANIDIEKLSERMELCIENQKTIAEMGQWARKYVRQKYNWAISGEALYKSIISSLNNGS